MPKVNVKLYFKLYGQGLHLETVDVWINSGLTFGMHVQKQLDENKKMDKYFKIIGRC